MRTIDAEFLPEAAEALNEEEQERLAAAFDDEQHAQEWRRWRTAEYRRHRRLDRIGDLAAAVLGILLMYALLHGRHGH